MPEFSDCCGPNIFLETILTLVFDHDFLKTQQNAVFYEILFMLLVALVVAIGLKIVGGLLIGALLVIPVLIAQSFGKSFKQNVILSVIVNMISVIIGIFASFYLDVPASSGIVLSIIFLYILVKTFAFFVAGFSNSH